MKKYGHEQSFIEKNIMDVDLTTPEHDELFIMFCQLEKMADVISSKVDFITYLHCGSKVTRYLSEFCCLTNKDCKVGWDKRGIFTVSDECPLKEQILNSFAEIPKDNMESIMKFKKFLEKKLCIESEKPVLKDGNFIVGFVDFFVTVENPIFANKYFKVEVSAERFLVEVKPKIKNIGEVIRQMNLYSTFLKGKRIIVTRTDGLTEIFRKMDIEIYVVK